MLLRNDLTPAWIAAYGAVDTAWKLPLTDDCTATAQPKDRTYAELLAVIAELKEERDRLLQLATRDCLTGLWNRRAILEILSKACAQADRERRPFAVVMADIDGFKGINDRFGHLAGDAVLRETAARLSAQVRRTDEVGRYGGEEFLIVLEGCGSRGAASRAEHLRATLEREPMAIAGDRISVTCSFGVYVAGAPARECDELVRMADTALYRAKRAGRNRVVLVDGHAPATATPQS